MLHTNFCELFEIMGVRQGRSHELTPFTGQTAGLIRKVLPAAEIVREMVNGPSRPCKGLRL